jgi:hypothetical protein
LAKLVNGNSSWMLCCNAWCGMVRVVADICHSLGISRQMALPALCNIMLQIEGRSSTRGCWAMPCSSCHQNRWGNFVLLFHRPVHHNWMDFLTISD